MLTVSLVSLLTCGAAASPAFQDRLQPVDRNSGFHVEGYFVWCGSVIRVGDVYHLFASRWPISTGFPDGYRQHSEIVRATSPRAEGPYTFAEVVIGRRAEGKWDSAMAHNPAIYRVGETFVLYYIGSDFAGSQGRSGAPKRQIGTATAPSITGPWTRRDAPLLLGVDSDANNPAAWFEPDGNVKLVWRDRALRVYISTAQSYEGPYTVANDNVWPSARVEDFFVFRRAGQYVILCEDNAGAISGHERWGVFLCSRDGLRDWRKWDPLIAYDHDIRWLDGTTLHVARRERPWLCIEDGAATCLFTSIQDGVTTWNQAVPIRPPFPAQAVQSETRKTHLDSGDAVPPDRSDVLVETPRHH